MVRAAAAAQRRHRRAVAQGISLDLSRGKPASEQLDLAAPLLDLMAGDPTSSAGLDCRNYGCLEGLPEARTLFARYLDVEPDEIWVQDNSSLRLMFDLASWCQFLGTSSGPAWSSQGPVRFLCPTPGYDRHFHLLAHLGIEMLPVAMGPEGPDLAEIEHLVLGDESIKGIFCVPRFSNPTGAVYSDRVVETLARMPTAAEDFRIFWDNAYARHSLVEGAPRLMPLLVAGRSAGQAERFFVFGSTSKVTLASAGLSMVAVSGANQAWLRDHLSKQSIGPNKIVQLAHTRFLPDVNAIDRHMRRQAALLAPKFTVARAVLSERLQSLEIASWTDPKGGYFISVDTEPGCATRVVQLAAEAGVKLTPAGATWPGGKDPHDRNLRLAPSFPSVEEVRQSAEVLADSIILATAEKRLS